MPSTKHELSDEHLNNVYIGLFRNLYCFGKLCIVLY